MSEGPATPRSGSARQMRARAGHTDEFFYLKGVQLSATHGVAVARAQTEAACVDSSRIVVKTSRRSGCWSWSIYLLTRHVDKHASDNGVRFATAFQACFKRVSSVWRCFREIPSRGFSIIKSCMYRPWGRRTNTDVASYAPTFTWMDLRVGICMFLMYGLISLHTSCCKLVSVST